jgi:glycosyltransferase involved in cell wall biosynthesis
MRISVAMGTYNGERFISEQLASLARQTLRPHELVVRDDASTDRTLEIVKDFSRSAPFPVLVARNDVNTGFTLNFLQAAARCSGELLAFCDQDDVWMPRKLERCVEIFRDEEIALMIHSAEVIDEAGTALRRRHPLISRSGKRSGRSKPPLRVLPPGFAMVLRRRVFDELWSAWPALLYRKLRGEEGNLLGHDVLLFCVGRDLGHIYYDGRVLGFFRVHGRNTTAGRRAFGPELARIWYGLMQSCRAGAADYRRIAKRREAERRLLVALCEHREFRSFVELQAVWGRTAGNLGLRAELYNTRGGAYWARFVGMLARGCYGRRVKGGLGIRSALKDLALGHIPIGLRTASADHRAEDGGPVGL